MIPNREIERVEALYKLYGFSEMSKNEHSIAFTYSSGYFHNAEIVCFEDNSEHVETLREEYEEMGFLVKVSEYSSYDAIHNSLFSGFFDLNHVHERLKRDYTRFVELQQKKLFDCKYEYIEPKYFWNNEVHSEHLISNIVQQLEKENAQLIIVEAAAGYGKTCTSYELLKHIAGRDEMHYAPIFSELSKNRKAALFRYVLLDEIDKKFTSLSSQLVIAEIQQGRVPLIIDGFDELISRSNPNMTNGFEGPDDESQTMLDTIAELFQEGCKTKVVLTSRKSAIFTGDIFHEWVDKKLPNCEITRIAIEEPTVQEWIGYDKMQFLENQRIPFTNIINPIVLAFMRNMDTEMFFEKCSNVENVIEYYFSSLLEREKERQVLQLQVSEQYQVMKNLAKDFVEFEIQAEELSFIKDLFMEIIHEKFNEYRERYIIIEEKPTEEEFATKLAGHALLNRISPEKNLIGFINDFIFGILIGENLIENKLQAREIAAEYIDIACTAFASRSDEMKQNLLRVVLPFRRRLNYEQQLDIELKLSDTIQQTYQDRYIFNRSFNERIYFDGMYQFQNCTFRNCTFEGCLFMTSAFKNCSFYDCRFYDVQILRDTSQNCELIFSSNCVGYENFAAEAAYEEPISVERDYRKAILRKFWASGKRFLRGSLPEKVILTTSDQEERKGLETALADLKRDGFLFKEGHSWFSNREKIKEIKEILEK